MTAATLGRAAVTGVAILLWPVRATSRLARRLGARIGDHAREAAVIGILLALVVGYAFWRLLGAVDLHLTPDAAHALADADALVGNGVRQLQYLPGFPALVVLARLPVGDVAGVHLALAVAYAMLGVGLFLLCRRSVGGRSAFVGAGVALVSPVLAELLDWSGGATLLATALFALSLVAFEHWLRSPRPGWGLTLGGGVGLTLATHPFVATVAVGCLAIRWLSVLSVRRRLDMSWGVLGIRGIVVATLPVLAAAALVLPRYQLIALPSDTGLRPPNLADTLTLIHWATRDSPLIALLLVGCTAAALRRGGAGRPIAAALIAAFVFLTAFLGGDDSYRSRIAYFIPIVVALGAALAWQDLDLRLRHPPPGRTGRAFLAVLPLLVVWSVAMLGFEERIAVGARFYQRLSAADLAVMDVLRAEPGGVVATSWAGNSYGEGLPNSWLIEGLAHRRAAGPVDPALSTLADQISLGEAMQKLFAGEQGLGNGTLQVALGPDGARADPAVAANLAGFLHPILFANTLVDTAPGPAPARLDRRVDGSAATIRTIGPSGEPGREIRVRLEEGTIEIIHRAPAATRESEWSLWLWPAYGVDWQNVTEEPGRLTFSARPIGVGFTTRDETVPVAIEVTEDAEIVYHEREMRFDVEAIEIRAQSVPEIVVRVVLPGISGVGAAKSFDEREILTAYDIRHVVVWRDTGWLERFDGSPCYERLREGGRIVAYEVTGACRQPATAGG